MQAFISTLDQMLTLCVIVLIGLLLRKNSIVPQTAAGTLAKLETWFFMPALSVKNYMEKCTPANLKSNYLIIVLGIVLLLAATLSSEPLSRLFAKEGFERRCYRYSLIIPNFGYLGIALVSGLMGADVLFKYGMFTLPFSFFVYSLGVKWLDPQNETRFSFRSFLTPSFLAIPAGMLMGLTGAPVPFFLKKVLNMRRAAWLRSPCSSWD